jgi:hypothetical protein
LQVEGSPLVPETPPEPSDPASVERRRKLGEEKQPRLLQIASAFAALDET